MKSAISKLKLALLAAIVLSLASATRGQCNLSSATALEYDRYQATDATWIVLLLRPKTSRDCLVTYARKLHREMPAVRYEFFDRAGPELVQYVRWASHGMSDDYFYPEKWLNKHHVATLLPFLGTGPSDCQWTLEFEKGAEIEIGRGPCHAPRN
jgi:hypothetical protein